MPITDPVKCYYQTMDPLAIVSLPRWVGSSTHLVSERYGFKSHRSLNMSAITYNCSSHGRIISLLAGQLKFISSKIVIIFCLLPPPITYQLPLFSPPQQGSLVHHHQKWVPTPEIHIPWTYQAQWHFYLILIRCQLTMLLLTHHLSFCRTV